MNNEQSTIERVTVDEMRMNLLSLMRTCFQGTVELKDGYIYVRLESGEKFVVSVMGTL